MKVIDDGKLRKESKRKEILPFVLSFYRLRLLTEMKFILEFRKQVIK